MDAWPPHRSRSTQVSSSFGGLSKSVTVTFSRCNIFIVKCCKFLKSSIGPHMRSPIVHITVSSPIPASRLAKSQPVNSHCPCHQLSLHALNRRGLLHSRSLSYSISRAIYRSLNIKKIHALFMPHNIGSAVDRTNGTEYNIHFFEGASFRFWDNTAKL